MLRDVPVKYLKVSLQEGFHLKEDDSYVCLFYRGNSVKLWPVEEASPEEIEKAIKIYQIGET